MTPSAVARGGARPGEALRVEVHELDREGAGVGGAQDRPGLEVHVAGALPGERVVALVEHVSPHPAAAGGGRRAWARLRAVERAAPERVAPACAAFGACGGCPLQHWDYAAQLAWKRRRVVRALQGLVDGAAVPVTVASPQALGYRNQHKLSFGHDGRGRARLGAFAPRSHRVVDVAGCRVVEPPLERVAAELRAAVAAAGLRPYRPGGAPGQPAGELRHALLRASARGQVLSTLVVPDEPGAVARVSALARALPARCAELSGVLLSRNSAPGDALLAADGEDQLVWGEAELDEEVDGQALRVPARAFLQSNREVARALYAHVDALVAPHGRFARALDVYAGLGAIARRLRAHAAEVIAIEVNPAAAGAYRETTGPRFVAADAAAGLSVLAPVADPRGELIVVNPPRAGCAPAVIAEIARLSPRCLVYVSCNPDTLARDLRALAGAGLRALHAAPFDMLPHTPHVETVVLCLRA